MAEMHETILITGCDRIRGLAEKESCGCSHELDVLVTELAEHFITWRDGEILKAASLICGARVIFEKHVAAITWRGEEE